MYGYKPRFSTFLIKNIMIYMKINFAHNLYCLLWLKACIFMVENFLNYYKKYLIYGYRILLKKERIFYVIYMVINLDFQLSN